MYILTRSRMTLPLISFQSPRLSRICADVSPFHSNSSRNPQSLLPKSRPNMPPEPLPKSRLNVTPFTPHQCLADLPQQIPVLQPFLHPFNSLLLLGSTVPRRLLSSMSLRNPPSPPLPKSLRKRSKRTCHLEGGEPPLVPRRGGGVKSLTLVLTSVLFGTG